jgi:dimeric dUTPase (all-alpha-NTP-PPase superfamily)
LSQKHLVTLVFINQAVFVRKSSEADFRDKFPFFLLLTDDVDFSTRRSVSIAS